MPLPHGSHNLLLSCPEPKQERAPMWDERYSTDDYVYGTEPNNFLREQAELIGEAPKRVLCLADGEGRNGVYLAGFGHWVTSVDASSVGLRKAAQLAEEKGVALTTLKPGALLILEAYTPQQATRNTGGPGTPDRTLTAAELDAAFAELEIQLSRECEREVLEGRGHTGAGCVVQFIARKP